MIVSRSGLENKPWFRCSRERELAKPLVQPCLTSGRSSQGRCVRPEPGQLIGQGDGHQVAGDRSTSPVRLLTGSRSDSQSIRGVSDAVASGVRCFRSGAAGRASSEPGRKHRGDVPAASGDHALADTCVVDLTLISRSTDLGRRHHAFLCWSNPCRMSLAGVRSTPTLNPERAHGVPPAPLNPSLTLTQIFVSAVLERSDRLSRRQPASIPLEMLS